MGVFGVPEGSASPGWCMAETLSSSQCNSARRPTSVNKSANISSGNKLKRGCCVLLSRGTRDRLIPVGQIARVSSLKAAGTRRLMTSSAPSS
jgi:hypothetical protein